MVTGVTLLCSNCADVAIPTRCDLLLPTSGLIGGFNSLFTLPRSKSQRSERPRGTSRQQKEDGELSAKWVCACFAQQKMTWGVSPSGARTTSVVKASNAHPPSNTASIDDGWSGRRAFVVCPQASFAGCGLPSVSLVATYSFKEDRNTLLDRSLTHPPARIFPQKSWSSLSFSECSLFERSSPSRRSSHAPQVCQRWSSEWVRIEHARTRTDTGCHADPCMSCCRRTAPCWRSRATGWPRRAEQVRQKSRPVLRRRLWIIKEVRRISSFRIVPRRPSCVATSLGQGKSESEATHVSLQIRFRSRERAPR